MYHLLISLILFCNLCNYVISYAMIGQNIKLTTEGQYNSVVSIKIKNLTNPTPETDHLCTGVLITRQDVLTAAHCEDKFGGPVTEVLVGSVDLRGGQHYRIFWWMTHFQWTRIRNVQSQYEEHDIAILRLTDLVGQSINVPKRGKVADTHYFGKTVAFAGFGSTAEEVYFRYMLNVDLIVLGNEGCANIVEEVGGTRFSIVEAYVCAVSIPCTILTAGNSGGPLFYDDKLIAIHKGTCPQLEDLHDPRKINLFLSTFHFNRYINDIIRNF